ncbi:hypothetical protein Acr_29g0010770 [Actinidia rufa]|uniref:Uncharacterized protein n=1 Tax=Actinidia rufa TaxID=165716 RepID=A0A7J0HG09_9ERIC|nr:hypothetical protein Acr_29g0010770 [Actinidia rufa]
MSGPQCCENPPTLSSSYGTGHVEELGGLKSYVSGSPESKIAVSPRLRRLWQLIGALVSTEKANSCLLAPNEIV